MDRTIAVYFLLAMCIRTLTCKSDKPNIVVILADDLGWNDVSFHGSDQIMTPNIDLLALSGVALGRYYSHAICTPSRTAFLTGKYSHKCGMQGFPLVMSEDRGIPVNETLLPEYFKAAGYVTHLVGKWHVGSSRNEYLPTNRGFDTHFGHRSGYMDYYDYTLEETFKIGKVCGLALYKNMTPAWDTEGYITDVYTRQTVSTIENHDVSKPLFLMLAHNAPHASTSAASLQAPPETVRHMRHVELNSRRMFAAMVKELDDSVGKVVKALYEKGILNNTIIMFASDNGGMTVGELKNVASNYPLRGIKMTPYEGGIRVVGLLWSAKLKNKEHYWDGYMHISDWMPTLLRAAGLKIPKGIDGINHWENINSNKPSKRVVMYEIDDYTGYGSIIAGQFKLITGTVIQSYSTYLGAGLRGIIGKAPSYRDAIINSTVYDVLNLIEQPFDIADLSRRDKTVVKCNQPPTNICSPGHETVCLYNIIEDPCETTDLSGTYPELVAIMKYALDKEAATRIPRIVPFVRDIMSAPSRFNFTWAPWVPDSTSS